MGQKVHPVGIRLGISKYWSSKWYSNSTQFPKNVNEDFIIRKELNAKLKDAAISRIEIERSSENVTIKIFSARPGIVIGKKGEGIETLRKDLAKLLNTTINNVLLNINEIKKPELDAKLVAASITQQLERRVMYRRAMKRAVTNTMRLGAEGIKVKISGRLNGAEIARTEWYQEGRVPLHTLKADIDYGLAEALTTYGIIGVKVWIFREEESNKR
ncbi:MAG: 30S ribosomal protein S3 [Gammaproteobacteria bacterium]|jgi:small subunit ribosomal protein S3|nr:30S ribosomal protein S3 [Gammaproteobacteria bacterium]MBT5542416.1 30S ribosomal protein S3 [Gammaproteobacteria bacterium]MBT6074009.1 30S ribosomal protein S3 [Gammaproteobacteria bacterium]MDG2434871.1 30S ribosomal protein S3 [Gammaproteobacteria bacterium]